MISLEDIKKLREQTQMPISLCKEALEKSQGDFGKAIKILEKRGAEILEKKKGRETKQGLIGVYLHKNGKISAMVKVLTESDFVSRDEIFKNLCHELAMQIAAMDPKDNEELLSQPYIKDVKRQVKDIIKETVTKVGENIKIEEFKRMEV